MTALRFFFFLFGCLILQENTVHKLFDPCVFICGGVETIIQIPECSLDPLVSHKAQHSQS